MNSTKKKLLGTPYFIWSAIFIVVPLCMVFYYGLTDKSGAFTMENILSIATPEHSKALWLALLLSLISTVICLLLAYPLAMILCKMNVNQHSFIVLIFILPMWMNFLLRTLAWQTLLEKTGVINSILTFLHLPTLNIINTPYAIVLGMVYNFLPFMVLPIYNALSKIDVNVINAARDLGANELQVFLNGTYYFCHQQSSWRKQDPFDRQRGGTGIYPGQQLAFRQWTFHCTYAVYHFKYGDFCSL